MGGWNSKLRLISPIQPSRDHLLLVQCRISGLPAHLSPERWCHFPAPIHSVEYVFPEHLLGTDIILVVSPLTSLQQWLLFSSPTFLKFPSSLDSAIFRFPCFPFSSAKLASFSVSFPYLAPGVPWGSFLTLCSFSAPAMLSPGHDHNLWGEAWSMSKCLKLHK